MPDGIRGKLPSITQPFDFITGEIASWAGLSGADKVIYESSATAQWYGALQSLITDLTCKKFLATAIKVFLGGVYYAVFITQEGLNPRLRKELQVMGDRLVTVVAEDLGQDAIKPKLAENLSEVTMALRKEAGPSVLSSLFFSFDDLLDAIKKWVDLFKSWFGMGGGGSSSAAATSSSVTVGGEGSKPSPEGKGGILRSRKRRVEEGILRER